MCFYITFVFEISLSVEADFAVRTRSKVEKPLGIPVSKRNSNENRIGLSVCSSYGERACSGVHFEQASNFHT